MTIMAESTTDVPVRKTISVKASRVDLEHRHLDRHGADGGAIRTAIDSPSGWGGLLELLAAQVGRAVDRAGPTVPVETVGIAQPATQRGRGDRRVDFAAPRSTSP